MHNNIIMRLNIFLEWLSWMRIKFPEKSISFEVERNEFNIIFKIHIDNKIIRLIKTVYLNYNKYKWSYIFRGRIHSGKSIYSLYDHIHYFYL